MARTDLLGPHGEGYCGRCAFVVGLDPLGMLDSHGRGLHGDYPSVGAPCSGSGRVPWKRTPYYSVKARFSTRAEKVRCHVCGKRVSVITSVIAGDQLKHHYPLVHQVGSRGWCPGTDRLVEK